MAAKKREKAGPAKETEVVTRTVEYLPPGVAPDLTPGTPSLDPELEKIREAEVEKLSKVEIDVAPKDALLDPELEKARDEQIKRETERANQSASSK